MFEITDEAIKKIEKLLLPEGETFDDDNGERSEVIKCIDESIDVNASPGSGKTTTLLAKLFLLAEQMPFKDGKGICVLTHTNVAIDELKLKVGRQVDNLFRYPNFFGTFQKFVNKFLAIPAIIFLEGRRPSYIDKELHDKIISDIRYVRGFNQNIGKKAFHYLFTYRNREKLTLCFDDHENLCITDEIDGAPLEIRKPRSNQHNDWSSVTKDEISRWLIAFKKTVLFDFDVMSFDDAYFFALSYLRSTPISEALSKRFKYVFVDEMQDTYSHQEKILNEAFDDSVLIQRFGDPHQAIYNSVSVENIWMPAEDALTISTSKRFGENIT